MPLLVVTQYPPSSVENTFTRPVLNVSTLVIVLDEITDTIPFLSLNKLN
jgi:hypothetical protein